MHLRLSFSPLSLTVFHNRGFCFFNSVAIAAKQLQHKLNVSKILIVDWVRTITGPHMGRTKQMSTCCYRLVLRKPPLFIILYIKTPFFAMLHLASVLSHTLTVNTVARSHMSSHSHLSLISARHMQKLGSGTSCRHPEGDFFVSPVPLNYTSWFAESVCVIDFIDYTDHTQGVQILSPCLHLGRSPW